MHAQNLTKGPIARPLINLALPLLLGSILQQLYNTIDAFIIGRYMGQAAFAAIGVAGTVMNLFIFSLSGCCTGISILLSQLYGSGDEKQFRNAQFLSAGFGCALTALLSVLSISILPLLLKWMQTPAEVAGYCASYLRIIFCGLLGTFFYNFCSATLRSVGNTRAALVILACAMLTNLALDYLFVAVFQFGIAGAAWATVISQLFSVVLCLLYVKRCLPTLLFGREDMHYNGQLVKRAAQFSAISALHQSSLYIGKLLVQGAVNSLGTSVIAAYTAATRIEGFANSFGDSGSSAISVFIAQNVGAKNDARVKQGLRTGLGLMLILGVCLSIALYSFATGAVQLMMGGEDAVATSHAVAYLHIISAFYCLCFMGNTFVGFYRGTGLMQVPFLGTTLHISIRVILSYLLIGKLGLQAVAMATGIGWISVVSFQIIIYFCKRRRIFHAAQPETR